MVQFLILIVIKNSIKIGLNFDDEAIKSKETSSGLRRHTCIKTSLNAFHTVDIDDYALFMFSLLPDLHG